MGPRAARVKVSPSPSNGPAGDWAGESRKIILICDHMKILTDQQYGYWLAWDENYQPDDNSPTGTGKTEQEAINDYKENKEELE